jgi:GT2 family glycosyltransferase
MSGRPAPSVSLIVLNWNGRSHLDSCLESLLDLDYPCDRIEIVLCDNGSTDGSVEHVRRRFPDVKVVSLERNHGFAEGNNLAAEQAAGEWLGFLNNDMWVERSWLKDLVSTLEDHPGARCLASRIKTWDGSAIDFVGGGVNYQGHGFQVDQGRRTSAADAERRVLFACGGAMLVRRDVFLGEGGFDADFFAFFEDVDLGWRLNLLGYETWYTPRATAFHRHHGTAGRVPPHVLRVLYERNALCTIYKCFEDENLDRVLPASLLLLNERALRLAGFDPAAFRLGSYEGPAGGEGPFLERGLRVLREEGPGSAALKAGRLLRRRLRGALGSVAEGALRRTDPGLLIVRPDEGVVWPTVAVSHFAAVSEFAHGLESLNEKRRSLQARRTVSDRELVPLMVDPFFANYADPEYVGFYRRITRLLGLDARFPVAQD